MTVAPLAANADAVFNLLVVSGDNEHSLSVRQAIATWPERAQVSTVTGAMAAIRAVLSQPPHLVIVDSALEMPGCQALVQQLARVRPTMPVLVFNGPAERPLDAPTTGWDWHELDDVLERWLLLQAERNQTPCRS